jgi:hypothetical protein
MTPPKTAQLAQLARFYSRNLFLFNKGIPKNRADLRGSCAAGGNPARRPSGDAAAE